MRCRAETRNSGEWISFPTHSLQYQHYYHYYQHCTIIYDCECPLRPTRYNLYSTTLCFLNTRRIWSKGSLVRLESRQIEASVIGQYNFLQNFDPPKVTVNHGDDNIRGQPRLSFLVSSRHTHRVVYHSTGLCNALREIIASVPNPNLDVASFVPGIVHLMASRTNDC